MVVALALSLLYLACAMFYQAHEKRTAVAAIRMSSRLQGRVTIAGWGLAVASLFLFAMPQGWERGVPLWFGAFTLAGTASLLIAALAPTRHVATGVASFIIAVLCAAALLIGAVT